MRKVMFLILFVNSFASCQFIDTVHSVTFGPNYSPGYGPDNQYFPQCIYGRHDTAARYNIPSFGPQNLLSLGTGGTIVLRFRRAIVNRPGPDFTVFENPFQYGADSTYVFSEVGIVGVSRNGVTFTEFHYRWDTIASGRYRYYNLAGATPVNGLAGPFNWGSPWQGYSGGDSFDLDSLGIDSVYFVRIRDAANLVPDGGVAFDLDAIAVINQALTDINNISTQLPVENYLKQNYPNPFNPETVIEFDLPVRSFVKLCVYDVLGRLIKVIVDKEMEAGKYAVKFNSYGLSSGIYFY
ncbi:MAG: T9SS type A sorting domain-containing protein, partial [Ignavibacteria bacterium]|nr:T9SS type A sorting domain-containing protein [Ignavibacteria bacterium]